MVQPRLPDEGDIGRGDRLRNVDVPDFRADEGGKRMDGNGHGCSRGRFLFFCGEV